MRPDARCQFFGKVGLRHARPAFCLIAGQQHGGIAVASKDGIARIAGHPVGDNPVASLARQFCRRILIESFGLGGKADNKPGPRFM